MGDKPKIKPARDLVIELQFENEALHAQVTRLQRCLRERDTELAMLREALDTLPFHEYGDAQRGGCDAKGAWDCFCEAVAEHVKSVRSITAVYDAATGGQDAD